MWYEEWCSLITGQTLVVKHSNPTEGSPVQQKLQRIPEVLKDLVDPEVTKMFEQGVVKPSSSPWSSPIVMVRKYYGSWQFYVVYWKLNFVTRQDAYPLPKIDASLDSLAGATNFTTLNLVSNVSNVIFHNPNQKCHLKLLRLPAHLKIYPGILWDLYPPLQKERIIS